MLNSLAKKLKRAGGIVGLAATLTLSGQANAVIYIGKWDPAFGSPFTDLGWRGEATFEIPSACLSLSGAVWNSHDCSDNGMKILSAEVEFYDLATPSVTRETLFFDVPSTAVLSMTVEGGALAGVNGFFPYFRPSYEAIAGYSDFQLSFVDLSFFSNLKPFALLYFENRECPSDVECRTWGFSEVQGEGGGNTFMTFRAAEVPEPGSLALMLPALGLLALGRRRKSAVA